MLTIYVICGLIFLAASIWALASLEVVVHCDVCGLAECECGVVWEEDMIESRIYGFDLEDLEARDKRIAAILWPAYGYDYDQFEDYGTHVNMKGFFAQFGGVDIDDHNARIVADIQNGVMPPWMI